MRLHAGINDVVVVVSRRLASNTVDSFSLYNNPLHCDCHMQWIATLPLCSDAQSAACNGRRLLAANETRCAGSAAVAGLTLFDAFAVSDDDDGDNSTCGPLVTALFDPVTYLRTGSTLRLDCRVTGLTSRSSLAWTTPARRRPLYVERSLTGTVLSVRHLESRDAGTYRCLAEDSDSNSSSSASTRLRLYNVEAKVLPVFVGSTSVTITWSGTDSTIAADYTVLYGLHPVRNQSDAAPSETDRGIIHLRPYLRKYAINDLRPGLTYEFCMTTKVSERDWMLLDCIQLTTKPEVGSRTTLISGRLVGVVLACVLTALLVLRCVCCAQQRAAYRQPGGPRWSSSLLGVGGLPLDQLDSQLTDADELVVSSRTSLIRAVS